VLFQNAPRPIREGPRQAVLKTCLEECDKNNERRDKGIIQYNSVSPYATFRPSLTSCCSRENFSSVTAV
jgi:hypothetical protein